MTLQQTIDLFLYLQDKYGSPNVIDDEVISYLNMATGEYINRLFPDNEGSRVNFEFDQNVAMNIQPLIWTLSGIAMNASGIVTDTVLNTALQSAASDANATYFRIGGIGLTTNGQTYPVKYVKQNNRWAYEQNYFKKPALTKPKYTPIANGLQFYPISISTPLTINVVKHPKVMTNADLANDMEFSDYAVYNILSIALKLAGLATRDIEMLEIDARLADLQITK